MTCKHFNIMKIPYIPDLEALGFEELELAMETGAAKSYIGCVNWPQEFPYRPDVSFSIARSGSCIAVLYHVRGLDLRAAAMEDNGPVWEDSCCEFFVAHPSDGTYFNFELNCAGTLLASKRTSRENAVLFTAGQLSRIKRFGTAERKLTEENGRIFRWSAGLCIPMDLIGLDPERLPASIRANFYKCADKSAHPHFLSWNPVLTPSPDFHRPEFFGELYF